MFVVRDLVLTKQNILPSHQHRADRTYDIEFMGYLSNHAKHAIVALDRLEAESSRVQQYWDSYTTVTPYNLQLHKIEDDWESVKPIRDDAEWLELRGKKQKWQQQVAYMNQQLEHKYKGDIAKLVQEYATPDLLHGLAGALTHGIIHLGWAIDANSPWMITEGLAYLNFCHLGVAPEKLKTASQDATAEDTSFWPMDSYLSVAEEFEKENLQQEWVEKAKATYDECFHPELVVAGFQWQVAKVLKDAHPVATNLPAWLETLPLDQLWEHMYRTTVWLYLATRDPKDGHGNFLVLHLITSLWGLEHVSRVVDNEKVTRLALGQFYASSVSLLATSGFPSASSLQDIQTKEPIEGKANDSVDWKPIVKKGIEETEEHNIKLVYVTRELWKRYNHWNGFVEAAKSFTITPNIGPQNTAFQQEA